MSSMEQDSVMSYDMRFHAFVIAAPKVKVGDRYGIGMPTIALNGGDRETLVFALRVIADNIEAGGTETIYGSPLT